MQPIDIVKARTKAKLSQRELAHLLGVKQTTVSRWESGDFQPSTDIAVSMCRILGLEWKPKERGYRAQVGNPMPGLPRQIGVTLPYEQWCSLDAIARKKNRNKADLLRPIIEQYINAESVQA